MNHSTTSAELTAARGALVVGAAWAGSGITPGFGVADSSRRAAFSAPSGMVNPASHGGIANGGAANALFVLALTGH